MVFQVPDVERVVPWIAQIAFRDNPKRPDRRVCARFRSVQRVVAVAIGHELAIGSARQIEIAHEHIPRIDATIVIPIARFTIITGHSPIVVAIADVVLGGTIANRR